MQNKKLIFIMGTLVLLVGAAAFVAGRMLNRGVNPLGLFVGDGISRVTEILLAEELPKRPPEAEGLFIERQDNILLVQADQSSMDESGGLMMEIVVTTGTILYRDTTQPPSKRPTLDNNPSIQQTVEEGGTLDELNNSQSLVMVWGRKSGDRVIAEVSVYSNLDMIQRP